ncbi:MAG: DUF4126 domain-containing protein [Flammeovirgaceae bacterium]
MEYALGLSLGMALSACCGFRVFIPLLVSSIASRLGLIQLTEDFNWMGSWTAIIIFGSATLAEVIAYYLPFVDNLLDTIAAPVAVIAGTLLTASFIKEMSPVLQWTLAIIVGGGSAGLVQASTSLLRLGSTTTTGGIANPMVSTAENLLSSIFSILAIFIPFIVVAVVVLFLLFVVKKIMDKRKGQTRSV